LPQAPVTQELRRRGVDASCLTQPGYEVDFLIRDERQVAQLIQVCASLDKPETVAREYGALYKARKATRCKELLLLTPDGTAPSEHWTPSGPAVRVEAIWKWLLDADSGK
jgi:predicted AAA+ superfamily ATPase